MNNNNPISQPGRYSHSYDNSHTIPNKSLLKKNNSVQNLMLIFDIQITGRGSIKFGYL